MFSIKSDLSIQTTPIQFLEIVFFYSQEQFQIIIDYSLYTLFRDVYNIRPGIKMRQTMAP